MMETKSILYKAKAVRDSLVDKQENPICYELSIIPPFVGENEIKLIIIGQDPTVKNKLSRRKIKCTLNLDRNGSLKRYIEQSICLKLNISIENIYATNLFKYFYSDPPSKKIDILYDHLEGNLELLKDELRGFVNIPIIILGEPLLQLFTNRNEKVRKYWGYKTGELSYSTNNDNKLGLNIYPFPHQPSIRKTFYKDNINKYLYYLEKTLTNAN